MWGGVGKSGSPTARLIAPGTSWARSNIFRISDAGTPRARFAAHWLSAMRCLASILADGRMRDGGAAVDHQRGPRDPGRLVGGEEENGLRDVLGPAHPSQRDVLAPGRLDRFPVVAGLEPALRHVGRDPPG